MTVYEDRFWQSRDGLKLHYRDYPGDESRLPVVCLHGLTRNGRDFAELAAHLAPGRRVLCPDLRGRGDSEYARDAASYNPLQYVEDLRALLAEAGVERFVAIGTSLGGLMTMILGAQEPDRIAGAVLNDIGPYLEPAGLKRIIGYVGQGRNFPTWVHAARALEDTQRAAHPGFGLADWIAMAKRVMTLTSTGRITFDYDMKIAEPFGQLDPGDQPDLWPAFQALAGRPLLFVRGALSDLLSEETLARMLRQIPQAEAVTLPGVGHAPLLNEAQAMAAIDRLLAQVE